MVSALHALTPSQAKTLQIVRDIARNIPDQRGETFEDTLAAICITESSAGRDLIGDFHPSTRITKASLGAMQIQIATLRFLSSEFPQLRYLKNYNDQQIANKLLKDTYFSARIAAYYIVWLSNTRKRYFNAVSGYNGGWSNKRYYRKVMQNMQYVRKMVRRGFIS